MEESPRGQLPKTYLESRRLLVAALLVRVTCEDEDLVGLGERGPLIVGVVLEERSEQGKNVRSEAGWSSTGRTRRTETTYVPCADELACARVEGTRVKRDVGHGVRSWDLG